MTTDITSSEQILEVLEKGTRLKLEKVPSIHPKKAGYKDSLAELQERGVDALGLYFLKDGHVELFEDACEEVARRLDLDEQAVKTVVLIHELCHAVHHKGRAAEQDEKLHQGTWKDFSNRGNTAIVEDLAEGHTYALRRQLANDQDAVYRELARTQETLAAHSPPMYKEWLTRKGMTASAFEDWYNLKLWEESKRLKITDDQVLNRPIDE